MKQQFQHIPADAPPMALLSATLSTMACFHPQFLAPVNDESFEDVAAQLISQIRTIAAFSYRRSLGLPFSYPDPKLRDCANFLHMMFSIPGRQYDVTPEIEDALNLILLLHADHEQNCSTLTTRVVGSSRANLFASCAAAACALWGPLHGGASVEVLEMLERIHRSGLSADDFLKAVKDKSHPFELFGFGHRVYKSYDPRAKILKAACERLLSQLKVKDPLLDLARKLEDLVLADPYFVDRRCTRKLTSTAESCSAVWEFPRTCSPSALPSAACPVGSPNGKSSTTTRPARFFAHGRSISETRSGTTFPLRIGSLECNVLKYVSDPDERVAHESGQVVFLVCRHRGRTWRQRCGGT